MQSVQVGQVLAVARRSDLALATSLAGTAGITRDWYGLGRRVPGPIRLIVLRQDSGLDTILHGKAPSWGAGFALPGARTIVIRADAGDPERILTHELAHLALHDAVTQRVPLWFDEGYASVAAGEWDRIDALRLNLTVARGIVPGFNELDRSLRAGQSTAEAAYSLAASAVAYLARRHPDHSLSPLLGRLAGGQGFDEAVLATTGSRLGRLEEEWQRDVRKRYGLIMWVMAGGFWLLIAGVVMWASWSRRRREGPRRAALDQGWTVEEAPADPTVLDEDQPAP